MGLDTIAVGINSRQIFIVGDPTSASQVQSVMPLAADGLSFGGLYGSLVAAPSFLLNAIGLYDRQRSAIGAPGITAVNTEGSKTTYSTGLVAFTPAATATDFWQIIGSATKTVRVIRVSIGGIATAAASLDIQLIKRSTASTGGTPTAQAFAQHDSNDAVPTAAVNSFAANPSPLGTSAGVLRAQKLNLGATGSAGVIVWDFGTRNAKGLVLRGVAQSLNLNWNGAAVPAGTLLAIDVEFSEE